MDGRAQTGVVGCVHIDDYEQRSHPEAREDPPDKEDDRTRHVLTLNAHAEPVFLTYRGRTEIDVLPEPVLATDAALRLHRAGRGAAHGLADGRPGVLAEAFEPVPTPTWPMGITAPPAPGGRGRSAEPPTPAPGRRGVQLVPGGAVSGRPAHHPALQSGSSGSGREDAGTRCFTRLRGVGPVRRPPTIPPAAAGNLLRLSGRCLAPDRAGRGDHRPPGSDRLAGCLAAAGSDPWPILGIGDPRTDKRLDFVGGIRGTAELERRVNSGEMAIAFSLYPTTRGSAHGGLRCRRRSCRRRAPGSSPSCGVGCLCMR